MPRALLLAVVTFGLTAPGAMAYPWPVKPVDVQHPIRGNFDDPRSLRGYVDSAWDNPLSFHSGVDIQARDGTPVYAIASGTVTFPSTFAVAVSTPFESLVFGYWHVVPAVGPLQYVLHGQLLGYVRPGAGHVHLAEKRFGAYVNPLRRGGLTPYRDTTPPVIRRLVFYRCGSDAEIPAERVNGCIDLAVDAYDPPPIRPKPPWSDVVLSPTHITWSGLFDSAWHPLAFRARAVDFTTLLTIPLTNVYAPETVMNKPNAPGDYQYWLARNVDTTFLDDGRHAISVTASDIRGNTTTRALQFIVENAQTPSVP